MGKPRRSKPSSPADIQARAALARQEAARQRHTPGEWGVSPELLRLETANDVTIVQDKARRGQILRAQRSDAFTLLHTGGGLTDAQKGAADRYVREHVERIGVRTDDGPDPGVRIHQAGAAELVTQRMVDAGARIEAVNRAMGRADVQLLKALVGPLVAGEVRVWRVLVQGVTGETERHAQAAAVRRACENLALAWEEVDREERRNGRPYLVAANG